MQGASHHLAPPPTIRHEPVWTLALHSPAARRRPLPPASQQRARLFRAATLTAPQAHALSALRPEERSFLLSSLCCQILYLGLA